MAKRIKTVTGGRLSAVVCYTIPTVRDDPEERASRGRMSKEAQELINMRRSWQKLELVLAANFGARDLHVVLTYDNQHLPCDRDSANRLLRKLLSQLRKYRKARDMDTKYIYVTEQLSAEGGRLHHHMVLNGTGNDVDIIRSLWPYGLVEIEQLDVWTGYEALAKYLTKEPREVGKTENGARTWTPSIGLAKPKAESDNVKDNVTVMAPPGAIILDRREKHNEFGDYLYLKYIMPEKKELKKGQRPPRRRKKE